MKKILITAVVLVLGVGAVAYAMSELNETETYSWRYKVTVEIDTPDGVKSGSAVRNAKVVKKAIDQRPDGSKNYTFDYWVQGEAVAIDLGSRGYVFSTIDWSDYRDVMHAFEERKFETMDTLPVGKNALLTKDIPMFVTFGDPNDPMSIKLIKGYEFDVENQKQMPVDQFKIYFGEGVAFKRVFVEITDEPITSNITSMLPWLKDSKANIDGTFTTTSNTLPNRLHKGNFERPVKNIGGGYLHGGFGGNGAPLGLHGGNFIRHEKAKTLDKGAK